MAVPDDFDVIKVKNHIGLWDAELFWHSPGATHRICRSGEDDETTDSEMPSSPYKLYVLLTESAFMASCTVPESTLLGLSNIAWLLRFLQLQQNFLNKLPIVLGSTASSPFVQQMFWKLSWRYGPVQTHKA